jgi:hypothetical protein
MSAVATLGLLLFWGDGLGDLSPGQTIRVFGSAAAKAEKDYDYEQDQEKDKEKENDSIGSGANSYS